MSLLGKALRRGVKNESPVPYATRRGSVNGGLVGGAGGPMGQMSQVGTLFAVVDRMCTATAAPDWALHRTTAGETGQREIVEPARHAAAKLWANPNPNYTQAALIETVQQHIELAPTGDGFLVVVKVGRIPLELWPVRPDRMSEVPHPTKFLAGWVYKTPDGEKIPLDVDEVIHIKGTPNPENPYRGLGRVQSLLRDLHTSTTAAEYAANFFANSAQPGGLIEVDGSLNDAEFAEMRERWNEQHRGVNNAHRVAILEHGKWRDRSYNMRDLDFASLRNLSRDQILEAFGVSRATMGLTDGVNYAAAKAADTQFAKLCTVPRLERWRQTLNSRLLPMFGNTGNGVDFDYESPIPSDGDEENAERDSKIAAVIALSGAGWNPQETAKAYGLPDIVFGDGQTSDPDRDLMIELVKSAPAALGPMLLPVLLPDVEFPTTTTPNPTPPPAGADESAVQDDFALAAETRHRVRAAGDAPDVDLSALDAAWQKAITELMARYEGITAGQRQQLRDQIEAAVDRGDLVALAQLTVDTEDAASALHEAMVALALIAAGQAVTEGVEAGVGLTAVTASALSLDVTAGVVASLLGNDLATAAGREAARLATPDKTGQQVATEVDTVLRDRSTAGPEGQMGGALHAAANEGRVQTFASGPVGSLYHDGQLDKNQCLVCKAATGRFICTTEDLGPYNRLFTSLGGYRDCLGGIRCRCSVSGVWRPQQAPEDERPGVGVGES